MTARLIQVTLGAAATQISVTTAFFNFMIVQNNSGAVCRLGDASVSATKGISLPASDTTNSVESVGPFSGQQGDASQFYLFGTANGLIDVLLV